VLAIAANYALMMNQLTIGLKSMILTIEGSKKDKKQPDLN